MASLEVIRLKAVIPDVVAGVVDWSPAAGFHPERLPQICWKCGGTWGEANLWALEMLRSQRDYKTALSSMSHLHAYAKWLESESLSWTHFPARESERCLTRFRGFLVRLRDGGGIAPSTASERMSAVVRFYRWVTRQGLLSTTWPKWSDRLVGIRLTDAFGLQHSLRVASTDLAIPNRRLPSSIALEDGLLPVSREARAAILKFAHAEASQELVLKLRLGFSTGLRLGSITDLKIDTVRGARLDPDTGWYKFSVGPKARPPVATKFGVSGFISVPSDLYDDLLEYATSTRRLKRQALAATPDRDLLFLTKAGRPYGGSSRAVNVEMHRLRRAAQHAGVEAFESFHFHRTRATFATDLMRIALKYWPVADAVQLVREACLHKNEATTLRYVKFVQHTKAMSEAADAFTEAFMGLAGAKDRARA